jgi:mitochondrial ribonuclease P protein 3
MSANTDDFLQCNSSDVGLCRKRRALPVDLAVAQASTSRPMSTDSFPLSHPCKKIKKKHMDPAVLKFRCCIQQCCKNDDLQAAIDAYEQAIENQTRIEAQTFYSLLCLCDGLGDRGIHVGTPKCPKVITDQHDLLEPSLPEETRPRSTFVDNLTRRSFALRLKRHIDDSKLPLTENAYTALLRIFCRSKDILDAELILTEAESTQQCKARLRLYSPLLDAYCDEGKLLEAVRVWNRLSKKGLILSEAEYCSLIRCCCRSGNSLVFQRILSDLSEDVLVPSHKTTRCIAQWFESLHVSFPFCPTPDTEELHKLLNSIQMPYEESSTSISDLVCAHSNRRWTISDKCQIDTKNGMLLSGCLKGVSLQPVSLSPFAWNEMKRMNESIAETGKVSDNDTTSYQGGGKGRKVIIDSHALAQRQQHWTAFQAFLRSLNRPVDVLVDGANVGFHEQNFSGAPKHVDYNQIDWIIQYFIRQKKQSILLVMHSRHFAPNLMPPYAKPIVQKWIDLGLLYQTPPGMNDDWFWLHAALYFGPGTLIVTNDEMRDHHFQMVAPRSFLRWRERHQIHFSFGGWIKNDASWDQSLGQHREVKLIYPDTYSRRIQSVLDGVVIPLPKRGDKNRFLDGVFVADDEPEEEMYLCVRPFVE